MSNPTTPRKTRLKGDANNRPCVDCGVTKDRFKDFKPRQSRCAKHRIKGTKSDPACAACVALVNGNVRQPRCIECDSKRSGKRAKNKVATPVAAPAPVAPTPVAPVATPAPVEPVVAAPVATVEAPVAATPVASPAVEVAPTPVAPAATVEPVAVAPVAVEAKAEAPAPKVVKKARPNGATKADLAKLFDLIDEEPKADEGNDASPL
jgi:hypothetical protein